MGASCDPKRRNWNTSCAPFKLDRCHFLLLSTSHIQIVLAAIPLVLRVTPNVTAIKVRLVRFIRRIHSGFVVAGAGHNEMNMSSPTFFGCHGVHARDLLHLRGYGYNAVLYAVWADKLVPRRSRFVLNIVFGRGGILFLLVNTVASAATALSSNSHQRDDASKRRSAHIPTVSQCHQLLSHRPM